MQPSERWKLSRLMQRHAESAVARTEALLGKLLSSAISPKVLNTDKSASFFCVPSRDESLCRISALPLQMT